jgi:hypothetical protein
MAYKVFVSYKYADSQVAPLNNQASTTVRTYVDKIIDALEDGDVAIYKGEEDGEDMSALTDGTIWNSLKEKIKDSSVTIVLISKGMKNTKSENEQWIPQEVAYSLKEIKRNGYSSKTNGMLAVILPEEDNSYNHYFEYSNCPTCNTRTHKISELFEILRKNMFNKKEPVKQNCSSPTHSSSYHTGTDHSYIHQIEWHKFIKNPSLYIQRAVDLRARLDEFEIQKVAVK